MGKNMLGRAGWLEVGGGVFIPLPEKEPLQPTYTGDSGPRRPETPARAETPGPEEQEKVDA